MPLLDLQFSIGIFGLTFPVTVLTLFGLLGNVCFTSRQLIQWAAAERSGKAVVPVAFWWLSLAGAIIFIAYAYARMDIPFIILTAATLVPYIRNLRIYYAPSRPARSGPVLLAVAVVLGIIPLVVFWEEETLKDGWFLLGLAGSAVFGSRFYLQWVQSESRRKNVMSLQFWYLSLAGSALLLVYAIIRQDLVFTLSYLFNFIPYLRNIAIIQKAGAARTV